MVNQQPADHEAGDAASARIDRSHADFVQDQLQQARTTADHNDILRQRSKSRIAAAKKLKASLPDDADPTDSADGYHVFARLLDERAYYPPHDQRRESNEYKKIHKQMVVTDDKPCLVCGVKHSTLNDEGKNPFGAIAMETHHHTIEWALANAIDPKKFNERIRPGLKRHAGSRASDPNQANRSGLYTKFDRLYENEMSPDDIKAWVDHAADNLWVLCDVHHRHKFVGIHAITFPIWGPQDVVDAEIIAREIKDTKSTKLTV